MKVSKDDFLPYLDMELFWDPETGILKSRVHLKDNQQLIYLNLGSNHTPSCFKSIMSGVCGRLASLTPIDNNNKNK